MGQRMESPDYEFGDDCNLGEVLAAPLWLDGETPRFIYMRFSQIQLCDIPACVGNPLPPNDRVFKLEQNAIDKCLWEYDIDFYIYWRLFSVPPTWTEFDLYHRPTNKHYFTADRDANASDPRFALNEASCVNPNTCGSGGQACVRWGPEAETVLENLNMTYERDLFMELWPLDDGRMVYKFCKRSELTNVKILYDSTI